MKNFIYLLFIVIIALFSCEKEDISEYADGGVLPAPTISESGEDSTSLEGTTWVLTYFEKNLISEEPYDTLIFVMFYYSLNGNKYSWLYPRDYSNDDSLKLRLYGFWPFGDNGMWESTVVNTFISEGKISITIFENLGGRNNTTIKATFKRIQ